MINHQIILKALSAHNLVDSMNTDLALLTIRSLSELKWGRIPNQISYVLPKLLLRWNCVLQAKSTEVTKNYKAKTSLALAVLLHKYGFTDAKLTKEAIAAIDYLNDTVALGDVLYHKTSEIKALLLSTPISLKRAPAFPKETNTFYREGDILSFQLGQHFYAVYVHGASGRGSSIWEFYDAVFSKLPTLDQLKNVSAKGQFFNDGTQGRALFKIFGTQFSVDPANQILLIDSAIANKPSHHHLGAGIGSDGGAGVDLFSLQEHLQDKEFGIFKSA
jgi:hypothetical protein